MCFLFLHVIVFAQEEQSPKIGLTLSGGGAKGLAHIGILKAIDSAELQIDYITGSSMGAIIGGLYSIGYSGKELEKIALSLDWDQILSNQPSLKNIAYAEKDQFDRYALEIPIVNRKFQLRPGVLEGQELWLTLADYFYPVINQPDFLQFPIPFKPIATNIETGELIAIEKGNIVNAIRASMSIPPVFSPVKYDTLRLIDGGVSRNFPISDVIDMGATYTIGSNVGRGLLKANEINTILDVVYQVGAYKEFGDFQKELKLCNLYIEPNISSFSTADFNKAAAIIQCGNEEGERLYATFKHLADSLNKHKSEKSFVDSHHKICIDSYTIQGTDDPSFVQKKMRLKEDEYYSAEDLDKKLRILYGTQNYKSVGYTIDSIKQSNILHITVSDSEPTKAKLAINYNTFNDFALIIGLATKDFGIKNSRAYITAALSTNFRAEGKMYAYVGSARQLAIGLTAKQYNYEQPVYDDFKFITSYRTNNTFASAFTQYDLTRSTSLIGAVSYEYTTAKVNSVTNTGGSNSMWITSLSYGANTLNRKYFPNGGVSMEATAMYVFLQNPQLKYKTTENPTESPPNYNFYPYPSIRFNFNKYQGLRKHGTFIWQHCFDINFGENSSTFNYFQVGGQIPGIRNYVPFLGLKEGNLVTASIATGLIGFQYEFYKNLFATVAGNVGYYDFYRDDENFLKGLFTSGKWIYGGGISLGYLSLLGPMQFSISRSGQTQTFLYNVNIGYYF